MMRRKENIFFLVVIIMTIFLYFLPTGFENPSMTATLRYERGTVLGVDNKDLRTFSVIVTGEQDVTIRVEEGAFSGDTVEATNILLGQKRIDKIFKKGDRVLTVLQLDPSCKKIVSARAADHYRQDLELLLFACFALFLILFARFVGFKAIVSFVFTAFAFLKLLIPAFLNGYNPLLAALVVVFICTVVIVLLVGGVNRKGLVALLGTMSGITITALLAFGFGYYFKIPGTVQEYSEVLLYTGFMNLNFSYIFIATIFISAAGAVMDVSMDISAAQNEIHLHLPDLPRKELMKSGFHIASPVIGSMTTTLLFAYSGSFMFAFMAFMAKGTTLTIILNKNYISAEILHTLVGSFGLVLVAPLTAIIGAYVFSYKGKKRRKDNNVSN